jgi:RNA 3'-terminal phosphate cyclase (ATP)
VDSFAVIDGAGGGGQMLRNAVALSAVTGRPVQVVNVRGGRPRPGLRPQHQAGVRAVAEVCGAQLSGGEIGSREIAFVPGEIEARHGVRVDVGTAGSVTLILQSVLPALAHAPEGSTLTLIGGTDVPFSPPFEYLQHVLRPALAQLGPVVELELVGRGFYPKGGGEVRARVMPAPIRPISWMERGRLTIIRGRSYSLGLPEHIAMRMRDSARRIVSSACPKVEIELEVTPQGHSTGCGIALWAETETGRALGASALGERGKPAERVGEEAGKALLRELRSGSAIDGHLADQLVVWLALAEGVSEFTTSRATDHLSNAIAVAEAVAGARFAVEEGEVVRVRAERPWKRESVERGASRPRPGEEEGQDDRKD